MRLPKFPRPRRPKRTVSDLVDLAGLGCLDGAAWWIHPVAGLAVLGGLLLFIGWVIDQ
ncbi:hypothetical protein SAMN05216251_108224 [Actinacidiphila alni]|uniref:Uncharacterized protein n=1 Tax=Actinacidiphila alni TaxID=380248 RepID=A0A1I2G3L5_9ACTN|nr:hypothetical protein [Actinacidiphila alni]SFF11587.1 hypothetical protein SAMN05216251_108224 [Actinacidiphila alni]